MNILGISGSPNKNGNTAYAVQYALQKIKNKEIETKYISLSGKEINPCNGCMKCNENRKCVFDDDMTEIYESLRWCDALILGSPVFMGMVSGQMKVLMDRCVLFRPSYEMELELSGKIGCGIACGGFRNGGQEITLQNIHTFLLQQNMRVINDGFSFSHAGGTIVGEAKEDKLGLQTIDNLVENLKKMASY
ncbi:flavodoxin family protein [Bacteroidota bacterium]